MITGVIAPLAAECRTARPLRRAGWMLHHSGVGPHRAAAAATALVDAGAGRLLVWGTAGGLRADLFPGTLIVPSVVRDADGETFVPDPAWHDALRHRLAVDLKVVDTSLQSVAAPVVTQADKSALAGYGKAGAVDMETAAVARVAAERGVPFGVVRAIADPLELALPGVVLAARSDRLLALEIPLRLVARPREIPTVWALARAFARARESLVKASVQLAATQA